MMQRRWWALGVLCLFSSSCRSCGCFEGTKTYEHIDEPIKVELVRETKWVGGKVPGPMSTFSIRVHANPTFDEPTTCTKADLAENDVGTLVAFRCVDPAPSGWTLIRLGKSGRHFRDCAPLLGDTDEPSFADVPPLSRSAATIVGCFGAGASQTYSELFTNLVQELRETEGGAAVVRFLVEAASADTMDGDPWQAQVSALDAKDRALVLRQVCPSLRDAGTTTMRWIHAAALCPLEDAAIADAALERVRAAFKEPPADYGTYYWDPSFTSSAAIAMRTHATEMGAAGCSFAGSASPSDVRLLVAHAAIAFAKTPCAGISKEIFGLCDESLDCDGGLCSAAMLRPELEQWANQSGAMDGGVRTFSNPSDSHRVLLAATWAQGPLPADVVLANARRNYALDLGADGGPECWQRDEAGVKCRCSSVPVQFELCTMKLDGGRFAANSCSFLVDDTKKTIGDPRHACGHVGAQCISDGDCCIETTCKRPPDSGVGPSHCAP